MADKIVVLRSGVVEQVGPPLALYDRPANLFVATFIGSPAMNIIDGRLSGAGFVTEDGQNVALDESDRAHVAAGERTAKLGIRPEHISVSTDSNGAGLEAQVETVETTGAATYICCRIAKALVNVVVSERLELEVDRPVKLCFFKGRVHFFDAVSQLRIG